MALSGTTTNDRFKRIKKKFDSYFEVQSDEKIEALKQMALEALRPETESEISGRVSVYSLRRDTSKIKVRCSTPDLSALLADLFDPRTRDRCKEALVSVSKADLTAVLADLFGSISEDSIVEQGSDHIHLSSFFNENGEPLNSEFFLDKGPYRTNLEKTMKSWRRALASTSPKSFPGTHRILVILDVVADGRFLFNDISPLFKIGPHRNDVIRPFFVHQEIISHPFFNLNNKKLEYFIFFISFSNLKVFESFFFFEVVELCSMNGTSLFETFK